MEYYLEVISAGRRLPHTQLEVGSLTVGRHPRCSLVVPDRHTSRQQLLFEVTEDGVCRIRDLGDKNPVQLNNMVVKESELRPGDRIEVGETIIILRAGPPDRVCTDLSSVRFVAAPPDSRSQRVTVDAETVTGIYDRAEKGSRQRKLDAFYHLAEALAQAADLDSFFGNVLDTLFEAVPSERGFVGLGSPERGTFNVVRVRNDRGSEDSTIEMSQTILDEIKVEKKALLVQDAPRDLAYDGAQSIIRLGIRSFMCAPMFLEGEFMGLLYLDHLGHQCQFDEDDLRFLQGVAHLMGLAIDNLRFHEQLNDENQLLRSILERKNQLIARSGPMLEVVRKIQRLGENESPVMILGETGTGKELVARAIHDSSPRRDKPFVAFNCSTSMPSLIESELFGHVKGAFTDASRDHKGKFELAHGGTLFLDEIGEMPPETQVKILRVLQEKTVEPVGGERSIPVDIRLISATHCDLQKMREEKLFRDDLYYRLAVLNLELPPLRERGDDIIEIATALLPAGMKIDKAAQKALSAFAWQGNVRELQNVMEQSSFNAKGDTIRLQDLPAEVAKEGRKARLSIPLTTLAEMEAKHIRRALKSCKGNKTRAAEILGIARETLYQKLKLYDIS